MPKLFIVFRSRPRSKLSSCRLPKANDGRRRETAAPFLLARSDRHAAAEDGPIRGVLRTLHIRLWDHMSCATAMVDDERRGVSCQCPRHMGAEMMSSVFVHIFRHRRAWFEPDLLSSLIHARSKTYTNDVHKHYHFSDSISASCGRHFRNVTLCQGAITAAGDHAAGTPIVSYGASKKLFVASPENSHIESGCTLLWRNQP